MQANININHSNIQTFSIILANILSSKADNSILSINISYMHSFHVVQTESFLNNQVCVNINNNKNLEKQKIQCYFCKENHFLLNCNKFKSADVRKRYEIVKSNKLCFNCFGKHHINACSRKSNCSKCNKKHHEILHTEEIFSFTTVNRNIPSILPVIKLELKSSYYDKTICAYALIDTGSQVSLIDRDLLMSCKRKIIKPSTELNLSTISDNSFSQNCRKFEIYINNEFECLTPINVFEKDNLNIFIEENALKPITTLDFQNYLNSRTNKNLDWFFNDYVKTRKKIDYKNNLIVPLFYLH